MLLLVLVLVLGLVVLLLPTLPLRYQRVKVDHNKVLSAWLPLPPLPPGRAWGE